MGQRWSPFHSPQLVTSQSRKTTDTVPVHRVVCLFTPQLSLVLINRSRRDGKLSWRRYTAAVGRIRNRERESQVRHRTTRPPRTKQGWISKMAKYLTLSPERQSVRMSKITNDDLTSTVWDRMLYNCTHMATVGVKGLIVIHNKAR